MATTMTELRPARAFLREKFPRGGSVLCAVSGGLDSMCLLHFMLEQPGFHVTAAHFNHCLRGNQADRDESFVRDYCAKRHIPFVSGSGDVRAFAEKEGLSIEEAARRLRYDFLKETAEENGADAILTAHHADDNAETVLLSLITWSDANMAGCCFGGSKKQPFTLAGPHMANVLSFEDPTEPLTVGTIDDFISDYIERHPEAKVDYVHDEPAVRALC